MNYYGNNIAAYCAQAGEILTNSCVNASPMQQPFSHC
jgi:hypothetical protein